MEAQTSRVPQGTADEVSGRMLLLVSVPLFTNNVPQTPGYLNPRGIASLDVNDLLNPGN